MEALIDEFENDSIRALQFKYQSLPKKIKDNLIEISPIIRMKIKEFYEVYLSNDIYPKEYIEKLIYLLFDIKIQLFFILELDMGLYNHLIYNVGFDNGNIHEYPYILLRKLSLDQNIVVKSRILWERVQLGNTMINANKKLDVQKKDDSLNLSLIQNGLIF